MTREEALKDYVDCNKLMEQLTEKMANLKKIIFSEVGVPQQSIPKQDLMQGNVRSDRTPIGKSAEIIAKTLAEHGGKVSTKDLVILCNLTLGSVYNGLADLNKRHLIHIEVNPSSKYNAKLYSLIVHRDKSDLNSL